MSNPHLETIASAGPGLPPRGDSYLHDHYKHTSAVSWGAIIAGAAAAASLSLILLMLGVGLGLSTVSPWQNLGISAGNFGVSTIIWVTATQIVAFGIGGYFTGRLRCKWIEVHRNEVYFRDTAHGFLAWSVASLSTAILMTSAIGAITSTGVQMGVTAATHAASSALVSETGFSTSGSDGTADLENETSYFVDLLLRRNEKAGEDSAFSTEQQSAMTVEVARIFKKGVSTGSLASEDIRYIGQVVARNTDLTQQEADKRVAEIYAQSQAALHDAEMKAKEVIDDAREAAAYTALWLFVALLTGAFVASLSATYGGRCRDS